MATRTASKAAAASRPRRSAPATGTAGRARRVAASASEAPENPAQPVAGGRTAKGGYLNIDELLHADEGLPEDDVTISNGMVRVRGLNRVQAIRVSEAEGTERKDRIMLAAGMVEPRVTEDLVAKWQKTSRAGDIEKISRVIAGLSGMLDGDAKQAYKSA